MARIITAVSRPIVRLNPDSQVEEESVWNPKARQGVEHDHRRKGTAQAATRHDVAGAPPSKDRPLSLWRVELPRDRSGSTSGGEKNDAVISRIRGG